MINFCLYHNNCQDGFASALTVWMKYGWGNWKYIPVSYQEPIPEEIINAKEPIDKIFIVDFSYSKTILEELARICQGLICIDHHDTAPKDNQLIIFDNNHSGCVLTWKYLFGGDEVIPLLFNYVEDRDLWKWQLVNSRQINLGLEQIPRYQEDGTPNFSEWFNLVSSQILFDELLRTGTMLWDYKQKILTEAASHAWVGYMLDHVDVVCCENSIGSLTSELGEMLRNKYPDAPFILIYGISQNKLIVSLRSAKGEVHCGRLAQQYGGGGHHNSAGFKKEIINQLEEL